MVKINFGVPPPPKKNKLGFLSKNNLIDKKMTYKMIKEESLFDLNCKNVETNNKTASTS